MTNKIEQDLLSSITLGQPPHFDLYQYICRSGYILYVTKDNAETYRKCLMAIYNELPPELKLISFSEYELMVYDIVAAGKESIIQEVTDLLRSKPTQKFEIIRPIYGAYLDNMDVLEFNGFTFISSNHIKDYLQSHHIQPEDFLENIIHTYKECYVQVDVQAKDKKYADQQADQQFGNLVNFLRFVFTNVDRNYGFGIFDYRTTINSGRLLNNVDGHKYSISAGSIHSPLNGPRLNDQRYLPGEGGYEKVWNLLFTQNKNKFQNILMTAIDWIGKALNEENRSLSLIQSICAMECVLKIDPNGDYGKSVTAQLAEYAAFIIGDTYKKRIDIEALFKRIYGERSKIVHEGNFNVDVGLYHKAVWLSCNIVFCLLTKPIFAHVSSKEDLKKIIEKMRYE